MDRGPVKESWQLKDVCELVRTCKPRALFEAGCRAICSTSFVTSSGALSSHRSGGRVQMQASRDTVESLFKDAKAMRSPVPSTTTTRTVKTDGNGMTTTTIVTKTVGPGGQAAGLDAFWK